MLECVKLEWDSQGPLFPNCKGIKFDKILIPVLFTAPQFSKIKALTTITDAFLPSTHQVPAPVPSFYVNEIGRQFSPNSGSHLPCICTCWTCLDKNTHFIESGFTVISSGKPCLYPFTLPQSWKHISYILLLPSTSTSLPWHHSHPWPRSCFKSIRKEFLHIPSNYQLGSWCHSYQHQGPCSLPSLLLKLGNPPCQEHFPSPLATAAAAKSRQMCPTLCDPTDSSPPGSPVPGILQARTLEWVAISFSSAWKWQVKVKLLICVQTLSDSMDCSLPGSSVHGISQARVMEWVAIAFSTSCYSGL